jgi:hypothetical protein
VGVAEGRTTCPAVFDRSIGYNGFSIRARNKVSLKTGELLANSTMTSDTRATPDFHLSISIIAHLFVLDGLFGEPTDTLEDTLEASSGSPCGVKLMLQVHLNGGTEFGPRTSRFSYEWQSLCESRFILHRGTFR